MTQKRDKLRKVIYESPSFGGYLLSIYFSRMCASPIPFSNSYPSF
jgi:hypothetical protein